MESAYIMEQQVYRQLADYRAARRRGLPWEFAAVDTDDWMPREVKSRPDMPSAVARLLAIARTLARPVAALRVRLS